MKAAAELGKLQGLVLSAGIYEEKLLENTTDEEIAHFFDVNVFGAMKLARAAIPFMRGTKGSIVAVSSDAGLQGNVQCSLYGATKGALISFIRSLALELAVEDIRANVVCPGMWIRRFWKSKSTTTAEAERNGRMVSPHAHSKT